MRMLLGYIKKIKKKKIRIRPNLASILPIAYCIVRLIPVGETVARAKLRTMGHLPGFYRDSTGADGLQPCA